MPADPTTLRALVVGAIADATEVEPDELPDHRNLFDLDLDSLHLAEIFIGIEDRLGQDVPPELLDRFLDVGDAVTIGDVVGVFTTWATSGGGHARSYDEVVVLPRR